MLQQRYKYVLRLLGREHEHTAGRALALLAGTALLSSLVYWVAYSHVYNLLELYQQPAFDLYRRSQAAPSARWWLLLAFLVQGGLYWMGWRAAQRAQGRAAWLVVLGGALASGVVLLFMFPFGAADIFDYIMHGRILSVYGANPFYDVGQMFPHDPFYAYMAWRNTPSTYGPVWVLLSGGVAWLAGDGVIANVLAFKLLSGAFAIASAGLVADILRRMAPKYALAGVLVLAWNPVILYETFGNGHNDMVMVFWELAAVWLIVRRRYTLAVLALVVGTLVKFMPVLLIPAAGLIALREQADTRARLRFLLVSGLAALALAALAYLPFWRGPEVLTIVRRRDLYTTSLPAVLYAWLQPRWGTARTTALLGGAAALLTIFFAIAQGLRAWRDRTWLSLPRAAFEIALFYLLFTCLWFQEWYTIWPVALAALLPVDQVVALAVMLNYVGLMKPLVFGPLWLWRRPLPPLIWREVRLGPAVLAVPWLSVLGRLVQRRRARTVRARPS